MWQADDPGFDSPDLLFGASGTGHFFLRLWRPDEITRPLLWRPLGGGAARAE